MHFFHFGLRRYFIFMSEQVVKLHYIKVLSLECIIIMSDYTVMARILWTHLSLNILATVSWIDTGFSSLGFVRKDWQNQWWKPCADWMYSSKEICPQVSSQNKCLHCICSTCSISHLTWHERYMHFLSKLCTLVKQSKVIWLHNIHPSVIRTFEVTQ